MKAETAFNLGVLCGRLVRMADKMCCEELANMANAIEKLVEKEAEGTEDDGND